MFSRRRFVAAGLALSLRGVRTEQRRRGRHIVVPRVNGGLNLQPVRRFDQVSDFSPPLIVPRLVDLQMREVYELGFESIRTTVSFNGFGADLVGAIPYVRSARALGVDVLAILGQFGSGHDLTRALRRPRQRALVVDTYLTLFAGEVSPARRRAGELGSVAFQVLNEPGNFLGLRPEDYVRLFLAPTYRDLKARRPDLRVVAAAPVGGRDGIFRLRQMIEAGLEEHCDVVAMHVYDERAIELLGSMTDKPVWITETGARGTANHLPWFTDSNARMRAEIATAERIYHFVLFDLEPDDFRLIRIESIESDFASSIESVDLYEHLLSRVRAAAGGAVTLPYEQLVPDITRYFPTDDDQRVLDSARAAL